MTKEEAAKRVGFGSHDTAERAEYILDHAPQDIIDAVDEGDLAVWLVHDTLKRAEKESDPVTGQLGEREDFRRCTSLPI